MVLNNRGSIISLKNLDYLNNFTVEIKYWGSWGYLS